MMKLNMKDYNLYLKNVKTLFNLSILLVNKIPMVAYHLKK